MQSRTCETCAILTILWHLSSVHVGAATPIEAPPNITMGTKDPSSGGELNGEARMSRRFGLCPFD
jgi:hypothetical protein